MSIYYRDKNGSRRVVAGMTPGGDLAMGANTTRSGSYTVPALAAGGSAAITVTFDEPMPDDDFCVTLDTGTAATLNVFNVRSKTANGFAVDVTNNSASSSQSSFTAYYKAYKLYTVSEAEQNASDIATIKSYIPATTTDSNKLVNADEVDALLDTKQDELTFDNAPTAGSDNPVKSGGIKTALDAKQNTLTFDSTPIEDSSNPVTSDGIYDALLTKAGQGEVDDIVNIYGSKNLLNTSIVTIPSGLSVTLNKDKSVTIDGTNASAGEVRLFSSTGAELQYLNGCILSGITTGSNSTYFLRVVERNTPWTHYARVYTEEQIISGIPNDNRIVDVGLYVYSNQTFNSFTFYPMIRLGKIVDPTYQPYAMTNQQMTSNLIGLADNVNKNGSKNLLRITKATSTVYGVTFTVYDDGHIRVNGTANNPSDTGCNFVFSYVNTEHEIPKGRYTLSCDGLPHSNTFQCVIDAADSSYQYVKRIAYIASASLTTFDVDYDGYACFYAFLHVGNGTTVNNVDVYPMLRLASDPDDTHVPFAMTNRELTHTISDIGTILTSTTVTTSVTSGGYVEVCRITLPKGVWVLRGYAQYPNNPTGIRAFGLSIAIDTGTSPPINAKSGWAMCLPDTMIRKITSDTVVHGVCYQTSGQTLTLLQTSITAVRIK